MPRFKLPTGAVFILLALTAAVPAVGQKLPRAVVAVLDFQLVMRESAAAKDISRQINAYRQRYRNEIKAQEDTLRNEERKLKQQRAILTPQSFEQKRQEFERRVIAVQRSVQDRTRQLDRALNLALNKVQKAMLPIIAKLTENEGFNVVVDKSQVLFAKKSLDITKIVIAELNKSLPTLKVPEPSK
jgi:Skp family chaperone for outer membrane proteins